jgi:O-antigen/teichoic acid export membrane protein
MVLTIGEVVIYGSSFVRNMILARLLTKADFGIAAAFSMIITLLEFSAKLGIARFVVRDKEGNEPEFVATAHMVQGVAAVLSTILMLAAAWPMALLFGIPEQASALLVLALIPLLHGIGHLDIRRYERELRFGPSVWVEMIPQVAITLGAWPLATWLGDYRAVLVLLIVKAVASLVGSHVLAERPYRWRVHREYAVRMLRFGWPLLVNGFLMFGVLHGDQFLVASFYAMEELGPYAAAASLTLAPTFFFGRVFSSVMLPLMAKVQDEPRKFERRYRLVVALICAFSAAYSVGMILGAEALMRVVFGPKYVGSGLILAWLAASNAFRNIRIAPAIAAMARGDSVNQMVSNLWRVVALVPALAVAMAGQPVWTIAATGLLGEALACSASMHRLARHHAVPLRHSVGPAAWVTGAVLLAGIGSWFELQYLALGWSLALAAIGALAAGGVVVFALADSRRETLRGWQQFRTAGLRESLARLRGPGLARKPGVT